MLSSTAKDKKSSTEDFLSTKEASEIVSYSREYIGRLAREQKICSALVGGKWIVSLSSLQGFYNQAKIEEEILDERLGEERLVEQNVSDFISVMNETERDRFTSSQKVFLHATSTVAISVVGFLLFFSVQFFENVSSVAQVFNFDQSPSVRTSKVITLDVIEVTTSIDVANGVLFFPGQDAEAALVDPTLLFSDEVEVVEGDDGVSYVRMYDGEDFSNVPFVHLPASHQYYQEVEVEENNAPLY